MTRQAGAPAALVLALSGLAACSASDGPAALADGEDAISCAVDGAQSLAQVCSVERARWQGRLVLVVHHPGGGFRRFEVTTDGSGLAPADGADAAATRLTDGRLDVTVGHDRYLFPATARSHGPV